MSQITGDLLIALSKELPRVFSNLPFELSWSIHSLEKEPTVDGEIYNIKVSLQRADSIIVPFEIDPATLTRWNHALLTEHAQKANNRGCMTGSADLNDSVNLRIERMSSSHPFNVTRVERSMSKHDGSSYKFHYLSAGLGTKASGYPEFDSRHEDVLDSVKSNLQSMLDNLLPDTSFKAMKIDVSNNWLDESVFDELSKSAIPRLKATCKDLEENFDIYEVLSHKQQVTLAQLAKAREAGENVVSFDELDSILVGGVDPSIVRAIKVIMSLTDQVSRIRHVEAGRAVKLLSQSLILTALTQATEFRAFNSGIGASISSSESATRDEMYVSILKNAMSKLDTLITTLVNLTSAYELFVKAGRDAS